MEAGRDVCRDGTLNGVSPCMYISLICPVPFIWKEFLSYKHIVPLCRDDIMLTLQIVPGEIVPGYQVGTSSCKSGMKSVLSRQTSCPVRVKNGLQYRKL